MIEIIGRQPDDSTYDEILRELAFARMVQRGLDDSDAGRTHGSPQVAQVIDSWCNRMDVRGGTIESPTSLWMRRESMRSVSSMEAWTSNDTSAECASRRGRSRAHRPRPILQAWSWSESFVSGGMARSSTCFTAARCLLLPLSPGTTTASAIVAPWHSRHLAAKSGRTFVSKSVSASRKPLSAAAAGQARTRLPTSRAPAAGLAAFHRHRPRRYTVRVGMTRQTFRDGWQSFPRGFHEYNQMVGLNAAVESRIVAPFSAIQI